MQYYTLNYSFYKFIQKLNFKIKLNKSDFTESTFEIIIANA